MDARSGDTLLGQRLDEYRLDTLLGQGGMARVYRGVDVHLQRYVAIKVIDAPFRSDPEYIRRFEREAQAIARLDHPNIVTLYRYGEAHGLLYMAMQYIEGTDLSKVLKNYRDDGEYIDPGDAVRIVREVCAALDYAHAHGVIHRDVKPSNILLDQQGVVHLTDFGLALLEELGTRGDVFGTPHYIAPEQAVSSSAVVPQSDFYAVGVILYEMFTGQIPFDADTPMDIAVKHMTEPVVPPGEIRPEINPELESVILKALSKSAEDRYETGAALAGAVDQAVRRGADARRSLSFTPRPTRSLPDLVSVAMAENPLPPVDSVVSTPLGRGADQTPAPATPRTPQTATPGAQPPQRAPGQRRHPARLPLFAGLTATGFLMVFIVAIVVTLGSGGEPPGGGVALNLTELATPDIEQTVAARLTTIADAETATSNAQTALTETAAAPTPTATETATRTPTPTVTPVPSRTPHVEQTENARLTEIAAETLTVVAQQIARPTQTVAFTPSKTSTPSPTPTLAATATVRVQVSPTDTARPSVTPSHSPTADSTDSAAVADVTRTQERTPTPFTPPIDCPGAPPSRLAIGGAGSTVGHGRGVYERPGGRLTRTLLESSPFLVEGGPECVNRQVWWQIRTRNGIVGWISEGMVGDYFAEACPLSAVGAYELSCPAANPSRLRADQSQLMSWIRGLRMRAEPGLSAPQLDSLAYREVVDVIGGPACADGLIWWNVRVPDRGSSGWIAEASLENWLTIPEPWLACTGE